MKTIPFIMITGLALAEDAKDPHAACRAEIEALKARVSELALRIAAQDGAIKFYQLTQKADAAKTQADSQAAALEAPKPTKGQAKK